MQLLYTGAAEQGAEQVKSDLSLGGLVSKSQVPNDSLSNLFSTASLLSIQNKKRECKMIALKNDDLTNASNLIFTFSIENDSICKYKIAFVSPKVSGNGVSIFESIINPYAIPFNATFLPITNASSFNIASLNANAYLGLWLVREYNYDAYDLRKKTKEDWALELEASTSSPNTIERFNINLDYTI